MNPPKDYPIDVLEKGYVEDRQVYRCLYCAEQVAKGVIYPVENVLYEDWRYMEHHIESVHGSVFDVLLASGRDHTGLSDQQSKLLALIYEGKTDKEIQQALKIGSISTIRNHRFALRKKERQAKTLLALMNLVKRQQAEETIGSDAHAEIQKAFEPPADLKRYFSEEDGRLITYRLKEYEKEQLLAEVALLFKPKQVYKEKEVNAILEDIFEDYMLLRREMVDRGLLSRNDEGSEYRLVSMNEEGEGEKMDFKKEMKLQAKEEKVSYGIFQIKNLQNGKIFVGSTPNFKTLNGLKFMLNNDTHTNKELQLDWNAHGKDHFEFSILETVDEKEWKGKSPKKILEELLEKWVAHLQPYGENGYNK